MTEYQIRGTGENAEKFAESIRNTAELRYLGGSLDALTGNLIYLVETELPFEKLKTVLYRSAEENGIKELTIKPKSL